MKRFFFMMMLMMSGIGSPALRAEVMPNGKPMPQTEEEWRRILTPEQYRVLRTSGTECAFTGPLLKEKREGAYLCAGCGSPLFASGAKFVSGSGWPSFFQPIHDRAVREVEDRSHGMVRTEIVCTTCGGHLGHVFQDGPRPTGLRYCLNSAALVFRPKPGEE